MMPVTNMKENTGIGLYSFLKIKKAPENRCLSLPWPYARQSFVANY
jgi:hypothetical protein